jgi:hypothetical protein
MALVMVKDMAMDMVQAVQEMALAMAKVQDHSSHWCTFLYKATSVWILAPWQDSHQFGNSCPPVARPLDSYQ